MFILVLDRADHIDLGSPDSTGLLLRGLELGPGRTPKVPGKLWEVTHHHVHSPRCGRMAIDVLREKVVTSLRSLLTTGSPGLVPAIPCKFHSPGR